MWDEWPSALHPKELMFFSADVVGSTSLKQRTIKTENGIVIPDNTPWFELIQRFYINAVSYFLQEFEGHQPQRRFPHLKSMVEPKIWKTIGDEILFWVEISDTRQVIEYLKLWIACVERLRKEDIQEEDARLDVKCSAWIAHFPWRNKIIFSSPTGFTGAELDGKKDNNLELMKAYFEGATDKLQPDFVGPGIDIGFRLAAQSNQRRFVISTDIAYMIAATARRLGRHLDVRVHFEGLQILKGVLGGLEYPVFWIDMSEPEDIYTYGTDLETRALCDHAKILTFMGGFYEKRSNYMYRPFIVSETEEILTDEPPWYRKAHEEMLRAAGFSPGRPA